MPVEVQIPQVFRRHTNGATTVQAGPGTLRQVLAALDAAYPGLRGQLLTPEGTLHRFVNVYVNQEDIRFLQDLETRVAEGDLVTILPAVAGGRPAGGQPPHRGRP
jgi:molybdopterin converting factor small subunit